MRCGIWPGCVLLPQLPPHEQADHTEQRRHETKRPAPAQRVSQQAAHQLPAHNAQRAAQAGAGQHFLQLVSGHVVTDPGHGQRNQRRSAERHEHTGHQQRLQAARQHRQHAANATPERGKRDDAELAQPVPQRAIEKLRQPVGDRKHRHHLRRLRQSHREHA